ncbi:MAG: ABC transporter substrate-binding protein [Chloroflexi bacterium]|nr:ABC transporter substrate-binding protein [Chloroflexota bacterium]
MSRNYLILTGVIAVVALTLGLAGCTQSAPPVEKAKPSSEQPKPTAAAKVEQQEKAATPATESATPAAAASAPKDLAVVRVGLQGGASDASLFIADGRGYFKEQGIQFQFEPFSAAGEMVPALSTGQLEVAGVMGSAAFYNALARGVRVKGVADKGRLSKGNGFIALLVRKDLVDQGKYKGLSDLKGMKVAIAPPAKASVNGYNLYTALKTVGLTMDDVDLVDLKITDMPAAFAGGSIDAGVVSEPTVVKAIEAGVAVRVLGFDEATPDHQLTGISYSEAFMKEKPDVARRFMIAYIKGARDYNDAFMKNKSKSEIIRMLVQATTMKDAALWEKIAPPGLNPDGYLNMDSLMQQVDWLLQTGQIKEKPKPEDFVDSQYVDYAIQQLGRYQ